MEAETTFLGWASYPIKHICSVCKETYDPDDGPDCECEEEEEE